MNKKLAVAILSIFLISQANAEQSQSSKQKIVEAIKDIQPESKKSPEVVLKSIKFLTPYQYLEVADVFVDRLIFEFSMQNTNPDIVVALLGALKHVATSQHVAQLRESRFIVEKRFYPSEDKRKTLSDYDQIITAADQRKSPWKSIHMTEDADVKEKEKPSALVIAKDIKQFNHTVPGEFISFLQEKSTGSPEKTVFKSVTGFITDLVRIDISNGEHIPALQREAVIDSIMDKLVRIKNSSLVLVAKPGVGKKTIIDGLAEKIIFNQFPQVAEYYETFYNAEILEVNPLSVGSASGFADLLYATQIHYKQEKKENKPLIVVWDNIDMLANSSPAFLTDLASAIRNSKRNIKFIFLATPETEKLLKKNQEIRGFFESLIVPEFTNAETVEALTPTWVMKIQKRYNVIFENDALELLVKKAQEIKYRLPQPEASIILLQDMAIAAHKLGKTEILLNDAQEFIDSHLPPIVSPLKNRETVQKILKLEKALKTEIKGQDEVIKSISELVTNYLSESRKIRPLSFMLVGATGTGKTAFGKALAHAIYGPTSNAAVVTLGNILETHDVTEIFGSKPGYVGMDTPRAFEEALKANPDGGVIVFDEASNMGGNNKGNKEALFKKFYELVYEGKWTSSVDGTTYDLTKYIFVFTGNDGEKLTYGIDSDDMRLAIWKENRSKQKVFALLREAGVPEAFLGRMADIILVKPLIHEVKTEITKKFLNEKIDILKAEFPGLKVTYDDVFLETVSETFYSHNEGARSLETFMKQRFGSLLARTVLDFGKDKGLGAVDANKLKNIELKLSLVDERSHKPYIFSKSDKEKVEIVIDIYDQSKNKVFSKNMNVTSYTAKKVLGGTKEAVATAYHEIGHATLNDPTLTGMKLAHITIIGGFNGELNYAGYARYEPITPHPNTTKESIIIRMAQLAAGSKAQELAGMPVDAGWSNDLMKMRELASMAIVKFGFEKEFLGVQSDSQGRPIFTTEQQIKFEEKKQEYIDKAQKLAEKVLKDNWQLVRSAAAELVKKGYFSGDKFEEAKNRVAHNKAIIGGKNSDGSKKLGNRNHDQIQEALKARVKKQEKCQSILATLRSLN